MALCVDMHELRWELQATNGDIAQKLSLEACHWRRARGLRTCPAPCGRVEAWAAMVEGTLIMLAASSRAGASVLPKTDGGADGSECIRPWHAYFFLDFCS